MHSFCMKKKMSKGCRIGLDPQVEGQATQPTAVLQTVNRESDKHMHWKHTALVSSAFHQYFLAKNKTHTKHIRRVSTA